MADEQERRAHRLELLAQYEEKKTRVAELMSQFTHKRLEEMTYEDLVHEAGLRQRFMLYPHIASPTIIHRHHPLGVFTKP
jgi:hypothetical protein